MSLRHRLTDTALNMVLRRWVRLNAREELQLGLPTEEARDTLVAVLANRVESLLNR